MKQSFFSMVFVGFVLFTSGIAIAQEEPDCLDPRDQSTMTLCAGIDFTDADAELNKIWPALKKAEEENDKATGKDEYVQALLASQRAWLKYRDLECVRQGFEAHGGSMEPMLVSTCMAQLTRERVKQLTADPK
jgi:uncharacterized protein YecT (DUF1311 family)